jgi:hypothetical protein
MLNVECLAPGSQGGTALPPIAGTKRLEMMIKDPYNNPSKDKVTLSFANCYDKQKVHWQG